jgi:hypothetical protein
LKAPGFQPFNLKCDDILVFQKLLVFQMGHNLCRYVAVVQPPLPHNASHANATNHTPPPCDWAGSGHYLAPAVGLYTLTPPDP